MSKFLDTGSVRSAQYIGHGFEVNAAEQEAATGFFRETELVFVLLEVRDRLACSGFPVWTRPERSVPTFPVGPK